MTVEFSVENHEHLSKTMVSSKTLHLKNPFRHLLARVAEQKWIPRKTVLQYYPPFLFMGVKIREISKDNRHCVAELPFRWYGSNPHGTIFGGFMCALADPIPAILCGRIFPQTAAWTKSNNVCFKRPAHSTLTLKVTISDEDIAEIQKQLDKNGNASRTFEFEFRDQNEKVVAEVKNTVVLKAKEKRPKVSI